MFVAHEIEMGELVGNDDAEEGTLYMGPNTKDIFIYDGESGDFIKLKTGQHYDDERLYEIPCGEEITLTQN